MARKSGFLRDFVPVAGCEEQWKRYLAAHERFEQAEAVYDKAFNKVEREGGKSSCKSWSAFVAAEQVYMKAMQAAFGSLDAYEHARKHIDDKIGVPEEEIRTIVIESLDDKLDELEFTVNPGLLGSKVAQAIRKSTSEGSAGDPPSCQDCE